MEKVEVLLPRPAGAATAWQGGAVLGSPTGARVAIVNNGWGSSDDFAPVLERVLRHDYRVAEVIHFRNRGHSEELNSGRLQADEERRGASRAFVTEVTQSADFVVTMLGN